MKKNQLFTFLRLFFAAIFCFARVGGDGRIIRNFAINIFHLNVHEIIDTDQQVFLSNLMTHALEKPDL